ncbi:MFS transporter [Arthrobacter sp. AZCC_0090]|uniref:MFS transporter n=1 Tax=Arthrobacter sp. AZCC_0090 TaxID=2735881 RepID=UPI0016157BE1|nr:MFS transporter [Arthrobacter sp. AZCC_0090]MBB6407288.1 metabolite-proton symporter [Arthrobacter sp. AZCC_0090]
MTVQQVTREQAVRRATVASVVGTTIEWYDFFLYGTAAALVFPQLFFPGQSAFAGILAAFGTQFVGFVARLVGAAIFGHFGDRIGRKTTLMATLFLMAFGTVLIGLLPTYQSIGVAAPVLLVLLRIIQGVGVGGEWGGSVLLSMEWGNQKRRGLSASWPQMGVPLGLVLSTGVVRLTSGVTGTEGFAAFGWRIPFILSIVLIGVGMFVRLRVVESPEFEAVRTSNKVIKNPILEVIKRQPKQIILSALLRTSEQAPFYLFITFVLTYAVKHLKLNSNSILDDTLIAAALGLISIPVFGRLSDRFGRRRVYGIGIVMTALFAFPYFGLLNTGNALLVGIAVVVSLVIHDMQYGPQAALIAESFDPEIRYTGAGMGYQLASVVAGGPAPLIAAALLEHYGDSTAISIYIVICTVVSMAALILLPRAVQALAATTPKAVGNPA